MAEPAALGCATLVGPHAEAASAVVAALQAHDPAACRRVADEREACAPPAKFRTQVFWFTSSAGPVGSP